jgi:hypothetical protein
VDLLPAATVAAAPAPPLGMDVLRKQKTSKKGKFSNPWCETITDAIKSYAWRGIKIVTDEGVAKLLARKLLESMNLEGYVGNSTEAKQKRDEWVELHTNFVVNIHNKHRCYVVNRIKEQCAKPYLDEHNGKLPPMEDVIRMLRRNFNPVDEHDYKLMKWYWTKLIFFATGNTEDWGPDTHLFSTMSTAGPPNANGDSKKLYVPPSTEAFAVLTLEGNHEKWTYMHKIKKEYPNKKHTPLIIDPKTKKPYTENRVRILLSFVTCQLGVATSPHSFPTSPPHLFLFFVSCKHVSIPAKTGCCWW